MQCFDTCFHTTPMFHNLKYLFSVTKRCASGNNVQPLGLVTHSYTSGQKPYTFDFIVCKCLQQLLILGIDFLK